MADEVYRPIQLTDIRVLAVSDGVGIELSSRLVSKQVLSPQQSLTSVFGMGTGGPSALKSRTFVPAYSLDTIWCTLRDSTPRCIAYPHDEESVARN